VRLIGHESRDYFERELVSSVILNLDVADLDSFSSQCFIDRHPGAKSSILHKVNNSLPVEVGSEGAKVSELSFVDWELRTRRDVVDEDLDVVPKGRRRLITK